MNLSCNSAHIYRARMTEAAMNDLVDGMERMGQMTFEELSDIAIMQVMDKLDIRSRHMMRGVSKRMNTLQSKVKNNLENIKLEYLTETSAKLTVTEQGFEPVTIQQRDYNESEHALSRLAVNTHVKKIELVSEDDDDCYPFYNLSNSVINELFNIEADELDISSSFRFYDFWEMNISMLLSLAQKFRKIAVGVFCESLRAQDLDIIREMITKGECKLEVLSVLRIREVMYPDVREYFGVTREATFNLRERSAIFRASDESIEIYTDEIQYILCKCEDNLRSTFNFHSSILTFERCEGGAKPDVKYEKMKLNYLYYKSFDW